MAPGGKSTVTVFIAELSTKDTTLSAPPVILGASVLPPAPEVTIMLPPTTDTGSEAGVEVVVELSMPGGTAETTTTLGAVEDDWDDFMLSKLEEEDIDEATVANPKLGGCGS